MAKAHATLIDEVEQELQDTSNTSWTAAELAIVMDKCLRELSEYAPYIMKETFQIESRTGTATSGTTTNTLEDTNESQFLATDDDNSKMVFNKTDNTWAMVTSYTDSDTIGVSKDIMADDEDYAIYNKDCWANNQINIGGVPDYIGIEAVEFEVQKSPREFRNWSLAGDILTIDIDFTPDDSKVDTTIVAPDVDVYVYFKKRHRLCRLTDTAALVNLEAGYTAGSTSMAIDELAAADSTLYEGTLFTIAGIQGMYTVTIDATITTSATTISFWPGLESAVEDNDVITIVKSTLNHTQERLLVDMTAARAMISKGANSINQIQTAIETLNTVNATIGDMAVSIAKCLLDIEAGRTEVDKTPALVTLAATTISKIDSEINQAILDLDSGRDYLGEVDPGGMNVAGQYTNHANASLATARSYVGKAQAYFNQATKDESIARTYLGLGTSELNSATSSLNQAGGYIREISSRLNVASTGRLYQDWGERKLGIVLSELRRLVPPKTKRSYPKD